MSEAKFNPEEFLKLFPKPLEHFLRTEKEVSPLYAQHCKIRLCNEFLRVSEKYIERILAQFNGHYFPAYRKLQEELLLQGATGDIDGNFFSIC